MPCFSVINIQTKFRSLTELKEAAEQLGFRVEMTSTRDELQIYTPAGALDFSQYDGQEFVTQRGNAPANKLQQIARKYATNRVKRFAKKNLYTVARGRQANQLVLRKYG